MWRPIFQLAAAFSIDYQRVFTSLLKYRIPKLSFSVTGVENSLTGGQRLCAFFRLAGTYRIRWDGYDV
jgi:hypothetical protein